MAVKPLSPQKQKHPTLLYRINKIYTCYLGVFTTFLDLLCNIKKLLLYRQENTAELIEWYCFIWPKRSLMKSWSDIFILEKYMETIY